MRLLKQELVYLIASETETKMAVIGDEEVSLDCSIVGDLLDHVERDTRC